MDFKRSRDIAVEMMEKREKFLVAMASFALGDDRPIQHVKRGKQRSGAVPKVIMGHALDVAEPHRQYGLAALQGLHLALFVHAQNQRFIGWIEVQSDHITHLFHEERISGKLETLTAVRLQP